MKLVILLETIKLHGELISPPKQIELEDSLAESLCASKVAKLVVVGNDDLDNEDLGSASSSPKKLGEGSDSEDEEEHSDSEDEEEKEDEDSSGEEEHSDSLDAMKKDSIDELKEVKGVGAEVAELLYNNGIKNIAELQTKKVVDLKKLGIAERQAQTIFNDAKNFG